jgi:isopentenyl-diphosphate delta-isomerase
MPSRPNLSVAEVDSRDRVVRVVARSAVIPQGLNFRVVHIVVRDRCGDLLLQRLPGSHERHPGRWGTSVAGYVAAGETYREAARRKVFEELSVSDADVTWLGKTTMRDERSRKFVGVFELALTGEFLPQAEDFASLRFTAIREVKRMLAARPDDFTPTFAHVVSYLSDREKAGFG